MRAQMEALPTILRLQELTYLELGNRIPCHANGPAKQKAHLIISVVKINFLLCSCMAFYDKSKRTEAFTVITVQLVNFHNLMLLLLGRAFCMTWNSVVLFHGG